MPWVWDGVSQKASATRPASLRDAPALPSADHRSLTAKPATTRTGPASPFDKCRPKAVSMLGGCGASSSSTVPRNCSAVRSVVLQSPVPRWACRQGVVLMWGWATQHLPFTNARERPVADITWTIPKVTLGRCSVPLPSVACSDVGVRFEVPTMLRCVSNPPNALSFRGSPFWQSSWLRSRRRCRTRWASRAQRLGWRFARAPAASFSPSMVKPPVRAVSLALRTCSSTARSAASTAERWACRLHLAQRLTSSRCRPINRLPFSTRRAPWRCGSERSPARHPS